MIITSPDSVFWEDTMAYNYIDCLTLEARERYLTKLRAVGLDKCPYKLPHDDWMDDPTQWPNVGFPDLYLIQFKYVAYVCLSDCDVSCT